MDIQPIVRTTYALPMKSNSYAGSMGQNSLHNVRYATNTADRLQNAAAFAPAAPGIDPLAPHPARCVCGCSQKYFPFFHGGCVDVYC